MLKGGLKGGLKWGDLKGAMSLIDSEAAFQKRCEELLDGLHDMFTHLQITTFSSLAFTVGTPQQAVSEHDMFSVLVRCVLQGSSLFLLPFWLKDFHLYVQHFCFWSFQTSMLWWLVVAGLFNNQLG